MYAPGDSRGKRKQTDGLSSGLVGAQGELVGRLAVQKAMIVGDHRYDNKYIK